MIQELNGRKLYEDLVEPVIVIDLKEHKIIYCNEACKGMKIISKGMDVSALVNVISTNVNRNTLYKYITESKKEYIIKNVAMNTFEQGVVKGDLRLGYVNDERKELYMMFKFDSKEVNNMFLKNRCYESIYAQSYSYPFRLDVKHKDIYFIGPILEQFNLPPVMHNYPQPVLDSRVLLEEDVPGFLRMVDSIYKGVPTPDSFRSYTAEGEVLWYHPEYVANRDSEGHVIEVIGEFVNIQEKRELEIKLHTDHLTGCLNKNTFNELVDEALNHAKPGENHGLLIIDVDNFKAINDNLGHQFGDAVLREAGGKLRKIFRSDDYVGRIGGDEFMVFMKSIDDVEILEERVQKVVEAFDTTYKGNYREYRTTASVGVAQYPKDGAEFKTLYDCVDVALYDTKNRGKNGYTFYHTSMAKGNMNNTTPFDAASRALSQHFDQYIIADVFTLLSEAKDNEASVNKVLEILGLRFNAQRCYIFEYNKEDSRYMDNTYEWCAPEVTPQIDNLQALPADTYQPLIDMANKEGIFYCNDLEILEDHDTYEVMKEQGILSFLLSFNKMDDQVTSVVGFDDCVSTRIWSSIEIATLMHVSKILNQFLKYMQAMKVASMAAVERLNVLDELYSYAYIVDDATCEIMYYNQELKSAFPEIEKGDLCYEVLHSKSAMCSDCPISKMKKNNKNKYRRIMPIHNLKEEVLVNASKIGIFEGKQCTFFSCSNLTVMDD